MRRNSCQEPEGLLRAYSLRGLCAVHTQVLIETQRCRDGPLSRFCGFVSDGRGCAPCRSATPVGAACRAKAKFFDSCGSPLVEQVPDDGVCLSIPSPHAVNVVDYPST